MSMSVVLKVIGQLHTNNSLVHSNYLIIDISPYAEMEKKRNTTYHNIRQSFPISCTSRHKKGAYPSSDRL